MDILLSVKETIRHYHLFEKGNKVLVACSGGPDSIALLYILIELRETLELTDIQIAHLDHCIRDNSKEDAQFVRDISKTLGIPCIVCFSDVRKLAKEGSLSLEDAGRRVRYRFLEQTRKKLGLDLIATGHTLNDQIETFFLRIDRGTGLKGLSLISPKRERVVRPLICTEKRDILRFLSDRNISYRTDETNLDLSIRRNLIRCKLVPNLLETLPNFGKRLIALRDILEQDEKIVNAYIDERWNALVKSENDKIELSLKKFIEYTRSVKLRVIKRALETMSLPCDRKYVEYILSFLAKARVGTHIDLPDLSVYMNYNSFIIGRRENLSITPPAISIPNEGTVELPDYTITTRLIKKGETPEIEWGSLNRVYFDFDRLQKPLLIRYRKRGDLFRPYGLGKEKRLKDLFIDDKIPSYKRDTVSLLVDSDDRILWIVGHRRSDIATLDNGTQNILELIASPVV